MKKGRGIKILKKLTIWLFWKMVFITAFLTISFVFFDWWISTEAEFMTQPSEKIIFAIAVLTGFLSFYKLEKEEEKKH
jgi:TRAP-type uncharacterized transport system fused permease subunit